MFSPPVTVEPFPGLLRIGVPGRSPIVSAAISARSAVVVVC
jgi:hypothetical protein